MDNKVIKQLKTKIIGKNMFSFNEIDSTQLKAKRLAEQNAANGTIVLTENQLAGQGTHGRKWYFEKNKDIAFTIILYPKCDIQYLKTLTIDIAKCIQNTISKVCEVKVNIKEPNDIILNDRKVGGILTQIVTNGNKIRYLLIGIGINVNGENFPEELENIATSLKKECEKEFARDAIIIEFCKLFEEYCEEKKII